MESVDQPDRAGRKYRKVPSEQAGYGPGSWVVQYYDRDMRVWFDVGDPLTEPEAIARLRLLRGES